jgi:hypothetical protein
MKNLIDFIKSHGHAGAWAVNGNIKVFEYFTDRDGNLDCEIVTLKPTIGAVKAWLGY